jgi:uncharacterized protein (TIGR03435 family)
MRRSLLIFILVAVAGAQTDTRARFEVASVKPAPESHARGGRNGFPPGKVILSYTRLKNAIPIAYGVQPYLVFGGPEWLQTEGYEIMGELGPSAGTPPPPGKALEALQVLLEERFKLRFHRESRIMPVYSLIAAKGGSKLVEGYELPASFQPFSDRTIEELVRRKAPMSSLASGLSFMVQTPVQDRTGLTGLYSFVLKWRNEVIPPTPPEPGIPQTDEIALIAALRSQLGLDLQKGKGPVEVMVIDSAERPKANE